MFLNLDLRMPACWEEHRLGGAAKPMILDTDLNLDLDLDTYLDMYLNLDLRIPAGKSIGLEARPGGRSGFHPSAF